MRAQKYPGWTNPDAELFHGTNDAYAENIVRNGVDTARGLPHKDFGGGFYTTTNRAQAYEWAGRIANINGGVPTVLSVTVQRTALSCLRTLAFVLPNAQYWSLIERCRDTYQLPFVTGQYYDLVFGPVASRFFGGREYTAFRNYDQISFHGGDAEAALNDQAICRIEVDQ